MWALMLAVFAYGAGPRIHTAARAAGLVAVVVVLLGCVSIGVEAALSYLVFGGWSLSYHQLNVAAKQSVTEFAAFAGGALSLLFSVQSAIAFSARTSASFTSIDPNDGVARQVGLSAYYTVTTLTGNGDPGPRGPGAHIVISITYAAAVLFLVVVISLLFDAISTKRSD